MSAREMLKAGKDFVCVVHYRSDWYAHRKMASPANPAVLLQVTLKPSKVSGDLIRLGDTGGDEISGWQWVDALDVVKVLGELQEDGKTVVPVGGAV